MPHPQIFNFNSDTGSLQTMSNSFGILGIITMTICTNFWGGLHTYCDYQKSSRDVIGFHMIRTVAASCIFAGTTLILLLLFMPKLHKQLNIFIHHFIVCLCTICGVLYIIACFGSYDFDSSDDYSWIAFVCPANMIIYKGSYEKRKSIDRHNCVIVLWYLMAIGFIQFALILSIYYHSLQHIEKFAFIQLYLNVTAFMYASVKFAAKIKNKKITKFIYFIPYIWCCFGGLILCLTASHENICTDCTKTWCFEHRVAYRVSNYLQLFQLSVSSISSVCSQLYRKTMFLLSDKCRNSVEWKLLNARN